MRALPGVLAGSLVFEQEARDTDGDLVRVFDAEVADAAGLNVRTLVQEHQRRTRCGDVVGLHLRTDGGEGRLVRCPQGAVLDVAVDLRPGSPTYLQWMTVVLDDTDHRSVWLPAGTAHGYQTLSGTAVVCQRVNRVHLPGVDIVLRYDDPELAIPWPLPLPHQHTPSREALDLAVVEPMLSDWFGAVR